MFICSKLICGYYWISNSQLSTASDVQMHMGAVPIEFCSHFIPFFVFNLKKFDKWTATSYLINVVHRLIILFIQSIWNWKKIVWLFLVVTLSIALYHFVLFCMIFFCCWLFRWSSFSWWMNSISLFLFWNWTGDRGNENWAKSHHHSIHLINKRSVWFWCFCMFVYTEHWKKILSRLFFPFFNSNNENPLFPVNTIKNTFTSAIPCFLLSVRLFA